MITRVIRRANWWYRNIPLVRRRNEAALLRRWLEKGKTGPAPHSVKQANLRYLGHRFKAAVLVETGTFRADMLVSLHNNFEKLFSVELSKELYEYSKRRCAGLPNVVIHNGDSAKVLPEICGSISGTVLFWLDGHYSGGDTALGDKTCPAIDELNVILQSRNITPVIVIDDARLFNGMDGYPTILNVLDCIRSHPVAMQVNIHDDAIVAVPDSVLENLELRTEGSLGK